MKYLVRALLITAVLGSGAVLSLGLGTSCGGDPEPPPDMAPTSYACDQTSMAAPSCREFTELDASTTADGLQLVCGPLTPGICPRNAMLLGGCRAKATGYTLTTWFYMGTRYSTQAQVMTDCGAAYVPPPM